jgi:gas vesicle protein
MSLEDLTFNTLGGEFAMNGYYNTQNIENPLFDFSFNIQNLGFSEAFKNFNTMQAIAPIAEKMNGKFNTSFTMSGALEQNMMPDYNTLIGQGVVSVLNAAITDSKILSGITSLTNLNNTNQVSIQDVILNAEIRDGKVYWDPFDIKLGNFESTVLGSNSLEGSLDFLVKMDVPAGAIGSAVNQAIAQLSGNNANAASSNLLVNLAVGGTYSDPKVNLASTEAGQSTASQAKLAVKEQIDTKKEELESEVKEEIAEQKEQLEEKAEEKKEEVKEEVKEKAKEEVEKAKDKLKKYFGGGK